MWSKDVSPCVSRAYESLKHAMGETVLYGTIAASALNLASCGGGNGGPPPPPQPTVITVSGSLKDAAAKGACADAMKNLQLELIYISNGNRSFPLTTDSNCNYSQNVTLLDAADSDKFQLKLNSGTVYNYLEDFRTRSNLAKDIYNFTRFTDPLNAGSSDYRKDLLEWLKWMTGCDGSVVDARGNPITTLSRWRDQDIPIAYFPDNPGNLSQPTLDAERDLETRTGLDLYNRVAADPSIGVRLVYGPFPFSQTVFEDNKLDNNGHPLYPLKVRIEIKNNVVTTNDSYRRNIEHEEIHALTFVRHSPFRNHMMNEVTSDMDLSDFEARAIKVLYGLLNNTDMARYSK